LWCVFSYANAFCDSIQHKLVMGRFPAFFCAVLTFITIFPGVSGPAPFLNTVRLIRRRIAIFP
tara:strand:- start:93343 stop:93531 length:189 start_codon:yes stop_codon:yes gene_type:complete